MPADLAKALDCYSKAAELGEALAQSKLGDIYLYGTGVKVNYKTAEKWYQAAAEQGDMSAQYNLGLMYAYGMGVGHDFQVGYMWLKLATAKGSNDAADALKAIQSSVSAEEVAGALKMIKEKGYK